MKCRVKLQVLAQDCKPLDLDSDRLQTPACAMGWSGVTLIIQSTPDISNASSSRKEGGDICLARLEGQVPDKDCLPSIGHNIGLSPLLHPVPLLPFGLLPPPILVPCTYPALPQTLPRQPVKLLVAHLACCQHREPRLHRLKITTIKGNEGGREAMNIRRDTFFDGAAQAGEEEGAAAWEMSSACIADAGRKPYASVTNVSVP